MHGRVEVIGKLNRGCRGLVRVIVGQVYRITGHGMTGDAWQG